MKTKFVSIIAFLSVLSFVVFFTSCADVTPPIVTAPPITKVETNPLTEKNVNHVVCQNPVIIGTAFDQSGSMKLSGTASVTAEDLKPLLKLISNCGGEIGATFVRDDSAKPIERLRIDEPPPPPVKPTQKADEEDYEFADRLDEYQKEVNQRETILKQNQQVAEPLINDYLNILAPLLAHKPNGGTDLWTGINRLDVYLSEDSISWKAKPHKYLVILSDGEDTIGKEKHPFKSDATVIWINATASEKLMRDFPYQRVESFAAAVKLILANEGGN